MKLIIQIKDSIYNPIYYQSLLTHQTLQSAIKYLAKLCLLLALAGVIIFAVQAPSFYRSIKSTVSSFAASYPDDLVVSIKDGNASVSKTEPYIVPMPLDQFPKAVQNNATDQFKNIIVIDTTQPFSIEEFKAYSTFALLTKTELVLLKDADNQIQILPLSKIKNVEVTKSWITESEATIFRLLPVGMFVLLLLLYIVLYIGIFVGTLVSLFLYAFVIWLIARIKHTELSYEDSYKLGIHAVTVILILNLFSRYIGHLNDAFIKIILLILIIYINFFKDFTGVKKTEEPENKAQDTETV